VEAHENGWLPWEREGLLTGYLLPFVFVPVATVTSVQLGPVGLTLLLLLAMRRARAFATADERVPASSRRATLSTSI
jgi:hypothetical protein